MLADVPSSGLSFEEIKKTVFPLLPWFALSLVFCIYNQQRSTRNGTIEDRLWVIYGFPFLSKGFNFLL
jgi:hypothetical protein